MKGDRTLWQDRLYPGEKNEHSTGNTKRRKKRY